MSLERVDIAPEVLCWARKSINLDTPTAAQRLQVSEPILLKWEAGELSPTIKQLRKAAQTYKRPLAVLLLSEPPMDFRPLRDFRKGRSNQDRSPELLAEFRRALMQREVFLELADLGAAFLPQPSLFPELKKSLGIEESAQMLRHFLDLSVEEQFSPRDKYHALRRWISIAEDRGVIVVQTKGISVSEMRGFSISEMPFSVIALNGKDSPRARAFTLLHELCHIALNLGGLCDLKESQNETLDNNEIVERYCNAVGAAVLLPAQVLLGQPQIATAGPDAPWPLEELEVLSGKFHISVEAILLRLITLGKASWATYWERKEQLRLKYLTQPVKQTPGGPTFYIVKVRNLGRSYIRSVLESYHSRVISSLDVADYLDIRFDQIPQLTKAL